MFYMAVLEIRRATCIFVLHAIAKGGVIVLKSTRAVFGKRTEVHYTNIKYKYSNCALCTFYRSCTKNMNVLKVVPKLHKSTSASYTFPVGLRNTARSYMLGS